MLFLCSEMLKFNLRMTDKYESHLFYSFVKLSNPHQCCYCKLKLNNLRNKMI